MEGLGFGLGLTISTNNDLPLMTNLSKDRLNELLDILSSMIHGKAECNKEAILPIAEELSKGLTEKGEESGTGTAIANVLGMASGQMGKLSKGGVGGEYDPYQMASTLMGAIETMKSTIKGGGRRRRSRINRLASRVPSVRSSRTVSGGARKACAKSCRATFSRTAGRRGKSRRRGNTRRRQL